MTKALKKQKQVELSETSEQPEWRKRISQQRTKLILDDPFFGFLALQMDVILDETQPTMCVDGDNLYVNPTFADKLSDDDLNFVLRHEVLHIALDHVSRSQARNPEIWNEAIDYVVNGELVRRGLKMPTTTKGLYNPQYTNMAAEDLYAQLLAQKQKAEKKQSKASGQGEGENQQGSAQPPNPSDENSNETKDSQPNQPQQNNDPGACGGVRMPKGNTAEVEHALANQKVRLNQALAIAKAQNAGNLPLELQRLAQAAQPKTDWRTLLRKYIDSLCTTDYTWSNPSRRAASLDLYLPGQQANGINHLAVAIDTSGSITQPLLDAFQAEIQAIFDEQNILTTTILYADTKVHKTTTYLKGDAIKLEMIGGGGTDFRDTFRVIQHFQEPPSLIIYFTDLEVYQFGEQPEQPVLWAAYGSTHQIERNSKAAPFGDVLHIQND